MELPDIPEVYLSVSIGREPGRPGLALWCRVIRNEQPICPDKRSVREAALAAKALRVSVASRFWTGGGWAEMTPEVRRLFDPGPEDMEWSA